MGHKPIEGTLTGAKSFQSRTFSLPSPCIVQGDALFMRAYNYIRCLSFPSLSASRAYSVYNLLNINIQRKNFQKIGKKALAIFCHSV